MKDVKIVNPSGPVKAKQYTLIVSQGQTKVIRDTLFSTNPKINSLATEKALAIFHHMQAGSRPCAIIITIFDPLTEKQADDLNANRMKIGYAVGGAVGGTTSKVPAPFGMNMLAGFALGAAARKLTLDNLPTRHSGDVIIALDAQVKGGIGPQHSTQSHTIHRSRYD